MNKEKLIPKIRFYGFITDWEQRKFHEIGALNRGKSKHRPRNDVRLYNGEFPFIQTGDVAKAGLFLTKYSQTYSDFGIQQSKFWDKGTLVITIAANIAETSILGIKAAFPDSIIGFNSNKVDMVFIKNIVDNASNTLRRKAETSSQANLNLAKLSDLDISLPTLEEQIKIGDFFKQLDNVMILQQQLLNDYKQLKKAMLQKMFPQKGETVPKIRFSGFTDDWKQKEMGELTEIKTGNKDVQDATIDGAYPFYIRSDEIKRINTYSFDGEAILIPGEGRLGEIFHYINGKFDFHQRVYKISDFTDVSALFLLYFMKLKFKRHAMKYTVKATVDSLRLPMIKEFEVIIPNIYEQKKIGNFFKQLDETIDLHQKKLETYQELKKAMLQKMFV